MKPYLTMVNRRIVNTMNIPGFEVVVVVGAVDGTALSPSGFSLSATAGAGAIPSDVFASVVD